MPTVQNVARTDAGLASELRVSVMRLRRRLIVEGLPDEALSLTQTSVLACLYRNGDLTVGDLAAFERVQPPSMTRTVKLLESGGYLTRRAHDTDGRQVVVHYAAQSRSQFRQLRHRGNVFIPLHE